MTASIIEQVLQISADVFNLAPEELTVDSSPATIETWDSLQHLNLVLALEESFRLEFDPDEMEQMRSVHAIVRCVQEKLEQAA